MTDGAHAGPGGPSEELLAEAAPPPPWPRRPMPVAEAATAVREGRISAEALAARCLAAATDRTGEGGRVFLELDRERIALLARAVDTAVAGGHPGGPLAGVPVAIKDLFDVAGERTGAGSVFHASDRPAAADAPAVARLRAAGAVPFGRTNMTEFAYSAVGLNPHYDTPRNPYDRATGRIPGGSTSGGAVAVADGMALAALGTDTGGSCRIPAALTGLCGYRPTPGRIPLEGVVPLSRSLDSVGALAHRVACLDLVDQVLAGEAVRPLVPHPVASLRLAVLEGQPVEDLDGTVAAAFDRALDRLGRAGARLQRTTLASLSRLPGLLEKGGIVAAEAHAFHRPFLKDHGDAYDPRIRERILWGRDQSAADYIDLLDRRAAFMATFAEDLSAADVAILPTVPVVAPPIADLAEDDAAFTRVNRLLLRNPMLANLAGVPALSLPVATPSGAPAGLMLFARAGADRFLFQVAAALEAALAPERA